VYTAAGSGRRRCGDASRGSVDAAPQTLAEVAAAGRDALSRCSAAASAASASAEQYVQLARSPDDPSCFDYSYPQLDAVVPAAGAPYPVPSQPPLPVVATPPRPRPAPNVSDRPSQTGVEVDQGVLWSSLVTSCLSR